MNSSAQVVTTGRMVSEPEICTEPDWSEEPSDPSRKYVK